jgi:hypothetical protein
MPMEFFLETVLVNWEEAVKSAVRECFAWMARFLNGLAAQVGPLPMRAWPWAVGNKRRVLEPPQCCCRC